MRQGTVKWYNGKKCFGFVSPDTPNEAGNKDDVFVHASALRAADLRFLNEGDIISFDDEERGGKLSATNVQMVKRDEESAKRFQERRSERRSSWGDDDRGDRGGDRGGFSRGPRRDRDDRGGRGGNRGGDRDGGGFFGKMFGKK
jgi:CspA family cold shock protein